MRTDDLKKCLPEYLTDTKTFTELFNAEGPEFDKVDSNRADLKNQFDVTQATWALDIYEWELGIDPDYSKSLDDRRSVIQSRWRGKGKLNAALIKSVCDAFSNGNTDVTFDGTIHVKFNSFYGVPPNLSDLEAAIDQIKPAWLLLEYLYTYLLISDINQVKTLDQMALLTLDKFAGGA